MSCVSCGIPFEEGVSKTDTILLIRRDKKKDSSDSEQKLNVKEEGDNGGEGEQKVLRGIPVLKALKMIFEMAPLQMKGFGEEEEDVEEERDPLEHWELCLECGECLSSLYNSFRNFIQMISINEKLWRKLVELEEGRRNGGGRWLMETEHNYGKSLHTQEVFPSKRKKGKKKGPGLIQNVTGGLDPEEGTSSGVQSVSKLEKEDGGDDGSLSSCSRPDSPFDLDIDRPRSPRPKRKAAEMKPNWAKYYQDDEDEEDSILPDLPDEGNETEVTMTEAEGEAEEDLQDAEGEDGRPKTEPSEGTSQLNLENAEEVGPPKEGIDDDSSDEDYFPDSDLENLRSSSSKRRKSGQSRHKRGQKVRLENITTVFECHACGQVFAHEKSLQAHIKCHVSVKSEFLCATCGSIFNSEVLLRRHRKQVHGEYIPYKTKKSEVDVNALIELTRKVDCPVCHEVFSQSELQFHVDDHKVDNPWMCLECGTGFPSLVDYNRHKSLEHKSLERRKESCTICDIVFRSSYHLRRHQMTVHKVKSDIEVKEQESSSGEDSTVTEERVSSTKRKNHKCSQCGKKYFTKDRLVEHLIIHGIGEKFKCGECGREFTHESSKKRHMLLHSQVYNYKCGEEGCRKEFSRKDHLSRHLELIHGIKVGQGEIVSILDFGTKMPKAKEIPCPFCDKMIKRERLRMHLVCHTGEKRHVCNLCGQKFGLRTTLRTHIQCVHQGFRRYACSYCEKAFKRSNHLKDHIKLHTAPDNKPFECLVCNKGFRRQKNLKSHMITHAGSRDFVCEQCGKAFSRMDNLKAHVRSVHEGIQIRKKKKSTAKSANSKTKAIKDEDAKASAGEISGEVPKELEDIPRVLPVKKPYPAKKRNQKQKPQVIEETVINVQATTVSEENPSTPSHIQVPTSGGILTLVDASGISNVITAEALGIGTVEIQEVDATGEHGQNPDGTFDGQRTTIVEIAPTGEIGQYHTTYYYYHQE